MEGRGKLVDTSTLLTSVLTRRLGFDRLAPEKIPPLYLYATTFVILDIGVVGMYTGDRQHALLENPFVLAISVFVLTAAFGIRYMTKKSQMALEDMRLKERSELGEINYGDFVVSFKKRTAVYLLFLGGFYLYLIGVVGVGTYLGEFGILPTLALSMVIYPLGYIPIVMEFVIVFISINFVLPKKVADARPKPAFLDPRDHGGFQDLGELFKHSYYVYTVCLLLYIAYIYGPVFSPMVSSTIPRAGSIETVFFMFLWAFGLIAIGSSIFIIHKLMSNEKEQYLIRLEEQFKSTVEDEYDILSADLHDNPEFEKAQKRKEQIRSMKEYPTSAGVTKQIMFSILLPQAVQAVLQIV